MSETNSTDLTAIMGFEVKTGQVLKNLNSDLYDEWYYDCLNYKDLLSSKQHVHDKIATLTGEGMGRYPPELRVVRNVPKKGLPVRYSLETDFYDRFIYQAICSFLIKFFDPLLSHRVLSHRKAKTPSRYLFQNKIERWLTYEGVTYTFKDDKKYLLATDLANYFENIRKKDIIGAFEKLLPKVAATSEQKQQIRNALQLLDNCLDHWSFNDGFGLAQNRDASSFLANVVLNDIDRSMEQMGYDYYRYVDDIRVICRSETHAKSALMDLISCLRVRGLNINSAKTEILAHDSPQEDIEEHFPNRDPRVVAIEQMWKSRDKAIILKSIKYLIALLKECIKQDTTQSRTFRYAANRLAQLSDAGVLTPEQLGDGNLRKVLLENVFDQPATTDYYCKILNLMGLDQSCVDEISGFLSDRARAIHDWQNYHLWMLLAKNAVKTAELRSVAMSILKSTMNTAEAGAVIIWADQVGYKSVVNLSIKRFEPELPFQLQRYIAIATRNYPRKKLAGVYPKISGKIKGTGDRASKFENETGRIVLPVREVTLPNLFDEMSEYD
ncbi:RNA-directed DNA polymerase [Ruegeria atlantica]|uniref:RNA-directed DNA polymerase n=1 Tax=Ruegeria atlantica TaxID=81569 RepID=UPI0024949FBD|nr:RNA-directed DNA polymerase [Ruegeria atlantica]